MYPNRFMIRLTKEIVAGKRKRWEATTAKVFAHEWCWNACTSHTRGEMKTQLPGRTGRTGHDVDLGAHERLLRYPFQKPGLILIDELVPLLDQG